MQHINGMKWLENLNRGHTTFLNFFGAHVYILFIIRVKILVLIQWSLNGHKGPPATLIILTIEPRIVILF